MTTTKVDISNESGLSLNANVKSTVKSRMDCVEDFSYNLNEKNAFSNIC